MFCSISSFILGHCSYWHHQMSAGLALAFFHHFSATSTGLLRTWTVTCLHVTWSLKCLVVVAQILPFGVDDKRPDLETKCLSRCWRTFSLSCLVICKMTPGSATTWVFFFCFVFFTVLMTLHYIELIISHCDRDHCLCMWCIEVHMMHTASSIHVRSVFSILWELWTIRCNKQNKTVRQVSR